MAPVVIPMHDIQPRLFNSASPWATTISQIQELYSSEHVGAVTTRTCTIEGYPDKPSIHRVAFFGSEMSSADPSTSTSSINTYGYSPRSLHDYLQDIIQCFGDSWRESSGKPVIISFTGSNRDIIEAWAMVSSAQQMHRLRLALEINLSCPNIAGRPPPAFDSAALRLLLTDLRKALLHRVHKPVPVGFKLPPYTHSGQLEMLRDELKLSAADGFKPTFLTSSNTLGNCLLLKQDDRDLVPSLPSEDGRGLGGVGGLTLHPLALGNVRSLRLILDQEPLLRDTFLIGVGGVHDAAGFQRMKAAGADAVAVATALGLEGVKAFERIRNGSSG